MFITKHEVHILLLFLNEGADITSRLNQQKAQEVRDKAAMADKANEDTVSRTTKTETGPGGQSSTTTVTTTTHKTKGTLVPDKATSLA